MYILNKLNMKNKNIFLHFNNNKRFPQICNLCDRILKEDA